MSEHDARSAALAEQPHLVTLEWKGHTYEVRAPSMDFLDRTARSSESEIQKTARLIIECTYWPPETPHDEKGKVRASTKMFNNADFTTILSRAGTSGTIWHALGLKVQEVVKGPASEEDAKAAMENLKGNSGASTSDSSS